MKPEDIFFCSLMTGPTVLPELSIVKNFCIIEGDFSQRCCICGSIGYSSNHTGRSIALKGVGFKGRYPLNFVRWTCNALNRQLESHARA